MPHLCDDLQFGFEETGRHGGTRLLSRPPIDDLHRQRVGLLLVGGGAHFGESALAELAADGVAESVQYVVHIAQVFLPVGSTRRGPSAAPSNHADDGFPPRSSVSSAFVTILPRFPPRRRPRTRPPVPCAGVVALLCYFVTSGRMDVSFYDICH